MPTIQIDNLGSPGIIKDVPAHELPVNAWSDGQNVRFRDNAVEKLSGHEEVYSAPPQAPFWLFPWRDVSSYYWIYGANNHIYRVTGTTHSDITRTSSAYTAGSYPHWNGGVLGGVPILNNDNGIDPPQSWDGAANMQDLPNWPFSGTPSPSTPKWTAKIVRPFQNFLVALNMREDIGGGFVDYPTRLRWSNPADPGSIPSTWIPAATNRAGSRPLSETTDPLVDCIPLRNTNILYKEETTHLMQFVGGVEVFATRQIFNSFGMLSDNCARRFYGKHLVVAKGDVVLHNGQSADSVITNKMRRHLFDSLDPDSYENSFMVEHPERSEMWICVPTIGSVLCDRAYIWNWTEGTWSIRDLPQTSCIVPGFIDRSDESEFIDDVTDFIDDVDDFIDQRLYNPAKLELLMTQPNLKKLFQIDQTSFFDGAPFPGQVERTGLAIAPAANGGVTVDTQSVKFVRRVYPKITADSGTTVQITLGAQQYIDGPVVWGTPVEFDPATQRHIDVRVNGRAIAIRFGSTTGGQWKLTSYGLDMDVVGRQ